MLCTYVLYLCYVILTQLLNCVNIEKYDYVGH